MGVLGYLKDERSLNRVCGSCTISGFVAIRV